MTKHPTHNKQLASLKRIEGQIRGIINMINNGKYIVVEETDFWRRGIMKKLPILVSLSIIALVGIFLTVVFK